MSSGQRASILNFAHLLGDDRYGGSSHETPPAIDSTTGAEIEQKNADVFQLEVGQCLNDGEETGLVDDVPTVDCASEHDSEVYFVFDLDDGDYPGATEVDDAADAGCLGAFTDYVSPAHSRHSPVGPLPVRRRVSSRAAPTGA